MAEQTVNPDGTFDETPPVNETFEGADGTGEEEILPEVPPGIDPAFVFLGVVAVIVLLYVVFSKRKKQEEDDDDFFSNLDGEKFNLQLPDEVDQYYQVKEKAEGMGWEPGQPGGQQASPAQRAMAQALMKRAIADIPMVTHIQKESPGMNKLYSQSMCSVKQWRSYQAAEQLVSSEVEEVRAEADQIEPGWSQAIWRQAMQYHHMLKQKQEQEVKAAEEEANRRKQIEEQVANARKQQAMTPEEKAAAAERAAQELLAEEERAKNSKKAFASGQGGLKKGFLKK